MSKTVKDLIGYILFFLTVGVVVSVSVVIFSCIVGVTDSKLVVAVTMLLLILFLTTVCFTIDKIRRKSMVDAPVEQILNVTERITKGDFSARLVPMQNREAFNEFNKIMLHLNLMAEELGKNEAVSNSFIANFSHEIKTPLAVIENYCEALMFETLSEERRQEYYKVLVETSKKLSVLLSNILKLNKLENLRVEPVSENFNFSELVRECVLVYLEQIEDKNINLKLNLDEIELCLDCGLVEIVVNNLISNAVKFTKNNIEVCVKAENSGAVLIVKDNGIGMTDEVGKHIFDKFYQGDVSHSVLGNGLGLALVKKVIDILGGEIGVKSEENKGSVFTVRFYGVKQER